MSISIAQFKDASRTENTFTTNQTGDNLVKTPTSFKGKVVAFFRGLFKPGTVVNENRGVMNAFITSLKSSRYQYGEEFGNMASQMLKTDIEQGKPLTGRKIKQVLDVLEERKEMLESMNVNTAKPLVSMAKGSDFRTLFAEVMQEKGLPTDPDRYDTLQLRHAIEDKIRLGGGNMQKFWPMSRKEAREKARAMIEDFTAKPLRALGVLEEAMTTKGSGLEGLERDSVDHKALETTVLMSQSKIRDANYLVGVMAMRETVTEGVKSIIDSDKSPSETFLAMKKLKDAMNQKMSDMGLTVGAEDILNFYQDCMNFCARSGDVSQEDMQAFIDMMQSSKGETIRNCMEVMLKFGVRSEREVATKQAAGHTMQLVLRMCGAFGTKLGLSDDAQEALARRPTVDSPNAMPRDFMIMLEKNGMGAPKLGNGLNEHLQGAFDQTFVDVLETEISSLPLDPKKTYDEDGINSQFVLDLSRCTSVSFDGVNVRGKIEDVRDKIKKAFTLPDGKYDLAGIRAVTGMMNQNMVNVIKDIMARDGEGVKRPFSGVTMYKNGTLEMDLSCTRDLTTGDMWITARTSEKQNMHLQDGGATVTPLDTESSPLEMVIQGRITRESIESGEPKFEIMMSNYDGRFIIGTLT